MGLGVVLVVVVVVVVMVVVLLTVISLMLAVMMVMRPFFRFLLCLIVLVAFLGRSTRFFKCVTRIKSCLCVELGSVQHSTRGNVHVDTWQVRVEYQVLIVCQFDVK